MKKFFLVLGLVSLTAFACDNQSVLAHDKIVTIKNHPYTVQLADTPEKRAQGLSGIDKITDTEGMLFLFGEQGQPAFWMKDMKFPIDILWISGDKIIEISDNIQPEPGKSDTELQTYMPFQNVDKVLEVNAGWASRHDINTGDTITISNPK